MVHTLPTRFAQHLRSLRRAQVTVSQRVGNPLATALFELPVGLLALVLALLAGAGAPTSD